MSTDKPKYYLVDDYFITPSLDARWKNILNHSKWGDGVRVVTGGNGSGKTMMARAIIGNLTEDIRDCYIELNENLKLTRLLDDLVVGFALNSRGETPAGENIFLLRSFHQQLIESGNSAVVVVDGAHYLDNVALSALVSIVSNATKDFNGINLFLFGAIGFMKRLDDLEQLDSPFYDFELPQFSQDELQLFLDNYIERNLLDETVGDKVLKKRSDELWAESLGMPGVALRLFERYYDEAIGFNVTGTRRNIDSTSEPILGNSREDTKVNYTPSNTRRGGKDFFSGFPLWHSVVVICLLVFLLSVFLFSREDSDSTAERTTEVLISDSSESSNNTTLGSELVEAHKGSVEKSNSSMHEAEKQVLSSTQAETKAHESSKNNPLAPSRSNLSAETAQTKLIPDSTSSSKSSQNSVKPESEVPQSLEKAPVLFEQNFLGDSTRSLRALGDQGWVLQVASAARFTSLKDFVLSQANKQSLYIYSASRNGRDWYIVVQGPYASKTAASQAISKLPAAQRAQGAWPRSLASVQKELN